MSPSLIRIDPDALRHNIEALRKEMAPAEVAFVVKGNAYGHGIPTAVPAAMRAGQRTFCTFSAAEAERVRRLAPGARIIVMGHVDDQDVAWAARHSIELFVNRNLTWQAIRLAVEAGQKVRVHLDLETGMHRLGLAPDDAEAIARHAAEEPLLEHVGTCTHLAGAEARRNRPRIEAQVARFEAFTQRLADAGLDAGQRHIASSSAALLEPAWRLDMVRMGIAMYGTWPTREVRDAADVAWSPKAALSWRSRVWSVQDVPAGESVGYGDHFQTTSDTRIAVVPVGYGDGFARGLSKAGRVLIRGEVCPIVGMVNMNMIQVDVTGHEVDEGDVVVLIGKQGDQEIAVQSFAEDQDMVNYELMTRLAQQIPRRGT